MNENNELSDIVLNKNSSSSSSKKMVLAIATLGIILIAVVTLMKSCGSDSVNGAPQAVIPPQPQQMLTDEENDNITDKSTATEEPLFEEVEVVEDGNVDDADLDKIAQKLKEESQEDIATKPAPVQTKPKVQEQKPVVKPAPTTTPIKTTATTSYYIQVGSFTKYEPNQKFLTSITKLGYKYTYHKVTINGKTLNKVLVGPFTTEQEARDARRILRSKVEPGAFLVKLK
ncbi:SPOR domain-containing protein [Sulfurimonas sp. C5]|uniref:SPOR domain-containing protein n=1 Tax=Sulfurimonas sp. C5 TaxID=3036947 RepID=UPI00245703C4|nr:SPOR domain-containing protein [Sulfurimonas sp. C5]MDH4944198.1 SPOR domain-containing protein [Sulfurimonas sp. C5]